MELKDIQIQVEKMTNLVDGIKKDAEKKSADLTAAMEQKLADFKANMEGKSAEDVANLSKELQRQYDEFVTKSAAAEPVKAKTLGEAMTEKMAEFKFGPEGQESDITNTLRSKSGVVRIEMPEVKAMGLNNLTGDPVASYGPRQAILPSQKVNFRDLIPTLNTETGLYVFYREGAAPNNIAKQSNGSVKAENTYSFSEVKVVQDYIAGTVTFTKQMATSLPWLTGTLPRLLMRDYFKKENALFNAAAVAAATVDTSAESDKVKKIIDFIAATQDNDYTASFIVVTNADLAELVKSTYTNGYYSGAGMVQVGAGLTIMGVPVIAASWATAGKALIVDNDFIERVQVKGLAIELSYENSDNFVRNQVTARIECQTELNIMLSPSLVLGTL